MKSITVKLLERTVAVSDTEPGMIVEALKVRVERVGDMTFIITHKPEQWVDHLRLLQSVTYEAYEMGLPPTIEQLLDQAGKGE